MEREHLEPLVEEVVKLTGHHYAEQGQVGQERKRVDKHPSWNQASAAAEQE